MKRGDQNEHVAMSQECQRTCKNAAASQTQIRRYMKIYSKVENCNSVGLGLKDGEYINLKFVMFSNLTEKGRVSMV